MTNNEIIEMACQAGFEKIPMTSDDWVCFTEELLSFAKLVAEKEREECARLADEWVLAYPHPSKTIAETIRARGDNA